METKQSPLLTIDMNESTDGTKECIIFFNIYIISNRSLTSQFLQNLRSVE